MHKRIKLEDMYVRFYRYAMDRLDKEQGGIVAFVTNNKFYHRLEALMDLER